MLATYAHGQAVGPETTLDELGLSSLDRIELALSLEGVTGVSLGEAAVAESATVADVRRALDEAARAAPLDETRPFPRWTRQAWARAIRTAAQALLFLPLARIVMRLQITGREHLRDLHGPVIFAANHQSLLDTPAVLLGLPLRWRRRLAVAMGTGFFEHVAAGRHGTAARLAAGPLYRGAVLFFDGFPLPETGPGTRATLLYAGELASRGVSILVFPEGQRTERGEIRAFRPGVGIMAARLQMPVVPVRL